MPNYVPGVGPFDPELMIIAEAPGKEEDEQLEPLVGPTGWLTREMLEASGPIKWHETYRTNVVKYRPPMNDFKKLDLIGVNLQEQITNLWEQEIRPKKPKTILVLGEQALQAVTGLTGILNHRGSILHAKDGVIKVVAALHPANLLRRPGIEPLPNIWKKIYEHDFERAINQSKFRDFRLPYRTLAIAKNSLDVFRFFREYEKLDKASVDIESINCIPVSISISFNKHHALITPLLPSIGPHKLTDMSQKELCECVLLIAKELRRLKIIGQNFKYDEFKLNLYGMQGLHLYSDTLLKVHTIFPELPSKGLAMQTSLFTEEPFYKDEGKESKIGKAFNVEQFFRYNGKDTCVNYEIDEVEEIELQRLQDTYNVPLVKFFYEYVMKKHAFYLKMENRGWKVDFEKKAYLKKTYEDMHRTVHAKLVSLVGYEVNTKSHPQIFQLLYQALKFPTMKKTPTSEDTIVSLLGNHCKGKNAEIKAEILETILEDRRVRDQLSRQINFQPDYDGRCKTSYKITGTETARTSTNILQKPVRPKKIGLAFHTISKHGRLAKDIRSMFIPDEGKVIIKADASQAEARIVSVLGEDWDLLKAFDTVDIHRRTAGLIFNLSQSLILTEAKLPIIDYLEKDGPERFCGKKTRHAGNYDMKKRRFMTEFNTDAQKFNIDMRVSEWRAGQMLELFHAASPRIKGKFHKDIQDALESTRVLINPYGRVRLFNGLFDEDLSKEGYAHIPQSTVADLVGHAALAADEEFGGDAEVYFCSEDHDALAIQAPINNWEPYAKVLQKHLQTPIDFSTYCSLKRDFVLTIPSDIEISLDEKGNPTTLADLRKVKF